MQSGATRLDLSDAGEALNRLPPEIAGLTGITTLNLTNTQVSNLTPLAGLTGITWLDLTST